MADVAVVLVTKDSHDDLARNLDELRAQAGVELDVLVVDNGSTDGTLDLLAARPEIRMIANGENRWLAPAWMQGVRATDAPYVCLLTPDTALPPDAIARLRGALEDDPRAALAGPLLFDQSGADLLNGSRLAALPGFGIRIEPAVRNIATLHIKVGARPDIRRIDAIMPISKAVIAFPNDKHPGNAPIVPLVITIDRDGIHRTLFPAERRRAPSRSSGGNTDRAAG